MASVNSNPHGGARSARPFVLLAMLAIVGGGLLSAAFAHAPSRHLMWLVAYLVLIVGVAQWLFGAGQSRLARQPLSARLLVAQCGFFNVGNLLVMAGTLLGHPAWVSVGAGLLLVALVLFLFGVRRAGASALLFGYRALLVLVGVSAGVGVLLSILRAPA